MSGTRPRHARDARPSGGNGRLRRTRRALLVASTTLLSGGLAAAAAGPAAADVEPGQGSSYAQAVQVTPHEGSLAVGVVLGEALAGHTNKYARAQSQGLDLGAIGTSLKSYSCGKPPDENVAGAVPEPLIVEAGQPGAAQGQERTDPRKTYGATERGTATATPYAEAETLFAPVETTLLDVSGAASTAWSGVVSGQREAGASVDIASVDIAAGTVVLQGLHWQAVYPSTGKAKPTGTFSVARAVVGGQAVPTGDLDALQGAVNQALGTIGIKLILPESSNARGLESVTPLQMQVVPNKNRDTVVRAILNGLAPTTNPIKTGLENGFGPPEPDQLQQALCQSKTPITVADIAIASISGAGFFNAALGGVNASSSEIPENPFDLSLRSFGGFPSSSQFVPGTPGTAGSLGSAPQVALPAPGTATTGGGDSGAPQVAKPAAAAGFAAGGPLLAIGLAGLAAVLAMAELDRQMIRRTRRRAAFED